MVDSDGTLKGTVSRCDLLKIFLREDEVIAAEVRHAVVARLYGTYTETFRVELDDGVVTLAGQVHETALIPLAARLARTVPGVADVRCALVGTPSHPDLDPDLPDPGRPSPEAGLYTTEAAIALSCGDVTARLHGSHWNAQHRRAAMTR
ncbi:BON domain-containing protein [Streptomyces sp. NPDC005373]|uniref:BON domain-containing protein n=1 Tax=Streptomyces sp. NPDC005373 TaxID=3156879 RepID=UPI0033A9B6B3